MELLNHSPEERSYHPVKQFIESAIWDGKPRVETLLSFVRLELLQPCGVVGCLEFLAEVFLRPLELLFAYGEGDYWTDIDDAGLRDYIESVYGIEAKGKLLDALALV